MPFAHYENVYIPSMTGGVMTNAEINSGLRALEGPDNIAAFIAKNPNWQDLHKYQSLNHLT